MSFKEFVASYTGRTFFERFGEFVTSLTGLVEQLAKLNNVCEAAYALQRDIFAEQHHGVALASNVQIVTTEVPCCFCAREVEGATGLALIHNTGTRWACEACAREKGLLNVDAGN